MPRSKIALTALLNSRDERAPRARGNAEHIPATVLGVSYDHGGGHGGDLYALAAVRA